jgi:phospholipase/carboxylesterase
VLTIVNGIGGTERTVVLLHGYAMRPEALAPFARSLGLPGRYHFPHAPHPAAPGGCSWWPINEDARAQQVARGPRDLADEHPQERASARAVLANILRDPQLCPAGSPLVVVGFSQGGMLACETILNEAVHVDGLVLLSSSRLAFDEWQPRSSRLAGLPVLIAHGRFDQDLAFSAGEKLRDWLIEAGASVEWLPLDAGHEIPLQAWRALRNFLRSHADLSRPRSPVTAIGGTDGPSLGDIIVS